MSGGITPETFTRLGRRRKPSKWKNKPVTEDGLFFPSQREHKRYLYLKLLQRAGEIERLIVHPRYELVVNDQRICVYEADFRYFDVKSGQEHVEDVKGARTALFILKRKLMQACLGINVEEIR